MNRPTDELVGILRGPVLEAVSIAVAALTDEQTDRDALGARWKSEAAHTEFGYAIEIPEDISSSSAGVLASAFAAAVRYRLGLDAGSSDWAYRPINTSPNPQKKIAQIVWLIKPEFDVQHTLVPAPEGWTGETCKDFIYDTDRPFCWGPYLAKFYMRCQVTPAVQPALLKRA